MDRLHRRHLGRIAQRYLAVITTSTSQDSTPAPRPLRRSHLMVHMGVVNVRACLAGCPMPQPELHASVLLRRVRAMFPHALIPLESPFFPLSQTALPTHRSRLPQSITIPTVEPFYAPPNRKGATSYFHACSSAWWLSARMHSW